MIESRNINELHPILRILANELIRRMSEKGYPVLLTSTYRDKECQDKLYSQGRTAPGSIVTNVKGGNSAHNHRVAFDICKNIKGQEYSDSKFFDMAGIIGVELGLEWGGSWTGFVDRPHFQVLFGYTISDFAKGTPVPQTIKSGCKDKRLVRFVQGLLGVEVDGSFGNTTKSAVMKYNPSGEIDAATLERLINKIQPDMPIPPTVTTALETATPEVIDARYQLPGGNDTTIPSITIDGTTYSNARMLLEAMDFDVSWDAATATRVISAKPTISVEDREIMYKIVQAEAGGEDEKGKVLVANVIMNRVAHKSFPNSIRYVVFQEQQFEPTRNGAYDKAAPSAATKTAVDKSLMGLDYSQGALYFSSVASASKSDNWHESALCRLFAHGGHVFYK